MMEKQRRWMTAALLLTAAILITAGAAAQQNAQVLAKSTRICLECIGIG